MCPRYRYKKSQRQQAGNIMRQSLDTDTLSPSPPSNHGIGPRSFPSRTAVGTVSMASCTSTIAAYFAHFIRHFLFTKSWVGVRSRCLAEISPLWPILLRKLQTTFFKSDPRARRRGGKGSGGGGGGGKLAVKKKNARQNIAPTPTNEIRKCYVPL